LSEFEIGAQGYIDIHIPKIGLPGFTITNPVLSVSGPLKIYDLIEEAFLETVNTPLNNQSRPSGFYRISVSNVEAYAEYVKEGIGSLIEVSHMVNYYQYSLNYYDKAGRLVKNVQPMGGESTFLYNSLGQLLEASSPDE